MWLGLLAMVISSAVLTYGIVRSVTGRTAHFEVIVIGGAALVGAFVIVALVRNEGVGFVSCDGRRLYLRRVCPAFLNSLPPEPPPPSKQANAGRDPPR